LAKPLVFEHLQTFITISKWRYGIRLIVFFF